MGREKAIRSRGKENASVERTRKRRVLKRGRFQSTENKRVSPTVASPAKPFVATLKESSSPLWRRPGEKGKGKECKSNMGKPRRGSIKALENIKGHGLGPQEEIRVQVFPATFLIFCPLLQLPLDARQGWLAALQDCSILAPLAWDLGLLILFVGQHSLMATETVKAWMSRYFGVLQRSLYVACTALALQVCGLCH